MQIYPKLYQYFVVMGKKDVREKTTTPNSILILATLIDMLWLIYHFGVPASLSAAWKQGIVSILSEAFFSILAQTVITREFAYLLFTNLLPVDSHNIFKVQIALIMRMVLLPFIHTFLLQWICG